MLRRYIDQFAMIYGANFKVRQYGPCVICGNPAKNNFCFKCKNASIQTADKGGKAEPSPQQSDSENRQD